MTVATDALLDIATSAATRAGDHALRRFRARVPTREKSGFHDLVTAVDHEAEDLIVEEILRRCPDSTIVAEERGRQGHGAVHWYVDPIDGTNNFARGIPFFCVSIAAAVEGSLVAAAIHDPVRSELIAASPDGTFLNGEAVHASGASSDAAALLLTDFPSPKGPPRAGDYALLETLISSFGTVRRLGSGALALAYVACGRADAAVLTNANVWDIAAGALLIERAGGQQAAPAREDGMPAWMGPVFVAACSELDLSRSQLSAFLRE